MDEVKAGRYRHFKGEICRVIGTAKHSETLKELVVYEHNGQPWTRPAGMFLEMVDKDGKRVPRFLYLDDGE